MQAGIDGVVASKVKREALLQTEKVLAEFTNETAPLQFYSEMVPVPRFTRLAKETPEFSQLI